MPTPLVVKARRPAVRLRAVMSHAERLADLLGRVEQAAAPFPPACVWLIGRAAELQCIVHLVASDWQVGRLSAEAAARRLNLYVKELHDGMAMHLDIGTPVCCRLESTNEPRFHP
jgi:hypothetical protein